MTESKNNHERRRSYLELQELLGRYCTTKNLSPYPTTTRTLPRRRRTGTVGDDDTDRSNNNNTIWTQEDTEAVIQENNISFDKYLGLRFYHSDPVEFIRAHSKDNLFIDYEFCVHEKFTVSLKINHEKEERDLVPGIITPQNFQDLTSSNQPKRIQNALYFMDVATIGGYNLSTLRSNEKWYWKRGSEMSTDDRHRIFASSSSSIRPQNVIQGRIGNCGFCSGFASLAAQFPEVIRSAFSFDEKKKSGALSIRLYPNRKKRFLLLDDYLLCTTMTTNDTRRRRMHSSSSLLFPSPSLHSLNEYDLWIRLLEKAFVKIQSSYASLDGYYKWNSLFRHPARALQLLTGAPLALELHYNHQKQNIDEIYRVLVGTEGRCARIAHGRKKYMGLRSGHGYSLLWVGTIAGFKLACVRNPHGKGSYTGEFGRGRKSSWSTPNALAVARELEKRNDDDDNLSSLAYLRGLLLPLKKEDNGIFLIGFDVFVQCFPIISIVGPIVTEKKKNQLPSTPLPELPNSCLHILRNKNISHLRSMLNAASSLSD